MSQITPTGAPPLVVYDLDGVVTRKDSFTTLVVQQLRSRPVRLSMAVPVVSSWFLFRESEARSRAAARLVSLALGPMDEQAYADLAQDVGQRIGADPGQLHPEVIERVQAQHAAGSRIVVATATEHRLAAALLKAARVPYDLLSASALEHNEDGSWAIDHRVGARKAEALAELGVDLASAEFVTDSARDLPTARRSKSLVLVAPSPRSRRRFVRSGLPFTDLPTA